MIKNSAKRDKTKQFGPLRGLIFCWIPAFAGMMKLLITLQKHLQQIIQKALPLLCRCDALMISE